ncbi:MAG: hypothetical protein EXX96DRAFT_201276 [Benjaminiella poitrasii]|nr:MAG: hypothetical protein EXX96DRAFT_201276 [Benjaminiella poitrasii]
MKALTLHESKDSFIPEESTNGDDVTLYECNICFDTAIYPVLTFCGHLYCWSCLVVWIKTLKLQEQQVICPVCKKKCDETKEIIPIYGRGEQQNAADTISLPNRPKGQRPEVITYARYDNVNGNYGDFGENSRSFRIWSRNFIISSSENRIMPTVRIIHESSSICIETGKMGFFFRLTLMLTCLYVVVTVFY